MLTRDKIKVAYFFLTHGVGCRKLVELHVDNRDAGAIRLSIVFEHF